MSVETVPVGKMMKVGLLIICMLLSCRDCRNICFGVLSSWQLCGGTPSIDAFSVSRPHLVVLLAGQVPSVSEKSEKSERVETTETPREDGSSLRLGSDRKETEEVGLEEMSSQWVNGIVFLDQLSP